MHHFKASISLYHIVSKHQILKLRLMPHLVVGRHICFCVSSINYPMCICVLSVI